MALPSTGSLTFSQINVELGLSPVVTNNLNATNVRTLAARPSGTIGFSDLRGKSSIIHTTTVGCGFVAEVCSTDGKSVSNDEGRGFWTNYATRFGFGVGAGTIIGGTVPGGHVIRALVEANNNCLETTAKFDLIISGHTVPIAWFNTIQVYNGTTLIASFSRGATGIRTTILDTNFNSNNVTSWSFGLGLNNRGQIFPTSGNRTVQFS